MTSGRRSESIAGVRIALASAVSVVAFTAAVGVARAGDPAAIDGVYRVSWTEKEMAAAGAAVSYAHGNHGVLTWTLRDGSLELRFPAPPLCHGRYVVSGSTISISEGPGCHGRVVAGWSLNRGRLRLHVTQASDPGDRVLFGAKPWKKIG